MVDKEKAVMEAFRNSPAPLSAKEVAERSGVDKKEVDKIIKKLKDAGSLDSPKRCYYQPK